MRLIRLHPIILCIEVREMRKRIIKKWINRYIVPLTAHLQKIDYCDREEYESHQIINGEIVPEGSYSIEYNQRKAIQRHVVGMKRFLSDHQGKVIMLRISSEAMIRDNQKWQYHPKDWRKHPKMKFYGIYTRLLVKKYK